MAAPELAEAKGGEAWGDAKEEQGGGSNRDHDDGAVGAELLGELLQRDGLDVRFQITDLAHQVDVRFTGMLPDLFREGQGVVAEGRFNASGIFMADTVLAKHDETYMPPEVADALKASGRWQADATHPGTYYPNAHDRKTGAEVK